MSKLSWIGRPWVVFDAANKNHRKWFADFQESGTWGPCPVRFVITDDAGDLITLIYRRLIEYYVDKEFNPKRVAQKQKELIIPKSIAKVAKPARKSKLKKVVDTLAERAYTETLN